MGENIAVSFLVKNRYKILDRNFRTKWGEIDIVAEKNRKVTFIEVKTRIGNKLGKPFESIDYFKLRGLRRAIQYYLLKKKLNQCKLSVDAIGIILDSDKNTKEIKHYKDIVINFGY